MSKAYSHKAMMAQLHIAPKELGMDEDTRRDFIAARFKGKRSSKDLTFNERFALLQAFKDAGWKPKKKRGAKQNNSYKDNQSRLAIVLWRELHFLGDIRNKSHTAMEGWIAEMTNDPGQQIPKRRSPDTLGSHEMNFVIEALKKWRDRVKREVKK